MKNIEIEKLKKELEDLNIKNNIIKEAFKVKEDGFPKINRSYKSRGNKF